MYYEIQETKQMDAEYGLIQLDIHEKQINKNIKEIKNHTFVSIASLDPESEMNVHKILLREVKRVRQLLKSKI